MQLRLYNYWRSSASYRVRIALGLKDLAYDYVAVSIKPGADNQSAPSYLERNPEGRVPTLETEGHVLTQSMAILEWLEEAIPNPPLLPADIWERAHVRSLAQIIVADIQPLQNLAVTRQLHTSGFNDEQVAQWAQRWIKRGLTVFEQQLARGRPRDFCHGLSPTLADVCLIPQCYAARRFGITLEPFPKIMAIERRCLTLEAFAKAAPDQQPDAETPP